MTAAPPGVRRGAGTRGGGGDERAENIRRSPGPRGPQGPRLQGRAGGAQAGVRETRRARFGPYRRGPARGRHGGTPRRLRLRHRRPRSGPGRPPPPPLPLPPPLLPPSPPLPPQKTGLAAVKLVRARAPVG